MELVRATSTAVLACALTAACLDSQRPYTPAFDSTMMEMRQESNDRWDAGGESHIAADVPQDIAHDVGLDLGEAEGLDDVDQRSADDEGLDSETDGDGLDGGADETAEPEVCTPRCDGVDCGPDGCGGTCGACDDGLICTLDTCDAGQCLPQLQDFYCLLSASCVPSGTEDPLQSCRKCLPAISQTEWSSLPDGTPCGPGAVCYEGECCDKAASCTGMECGPDGCGGLCGECVGLLESCLDGLCVCSPECTGKACGPDGCGSDCGECPEGKLCEDGACACKSKDHDGCCGDAVCWFDSCGNEQEMIVLCPWGCQDGTCFNCEPDCTAKECGPNGCGASCGECIGLQQLCSEGLCECAPACTGKQCGSDGCGGQCGTCTGPQQKCVSGQCVCQPACSGKQCGEDGCGGTCGECLGPQDVCAGGLCVCVPKCDGKECGYDGCGSTCGACEAGPPCAVKSCVNGKCTTSYIAGTCLVSGQCYIDGMSDPGNACTRCESAISQTAFANAPDGGACGTGGVCLSGSCCDAAGHCKGKQCGPDGCKGSCGTCPGPQDVCSNGTCLCVPDCLGKVCGADGCGGSCGSCPQGKSCGASGTCVTGPCVPDCFGKQCGDDGCTGTCGTCGGPQDTCASGQCACMPACSGKKCGPDGCGGSCGTCGGLQDTCVGSQCVCQPACAGKACGPDGCGSSCGACDDLLACTADQCIGGACTSALLEFKCLIAKACYESGASDPVNACGVCSPGDAPYGWTLLSDGTPCVSGKICHLGQCCDKGGNCAGKECGDDGCGGACGTCAPGSVCSSGLCQDPEVCDDGNLVSWDGCTGGLLSEFDVAKTTSHAQSYPATAAFDDQHYLVVWQSDLQDGDDLGVFGQVFLAGAAPPSADIQINSVTAKAQEDPDATSLTTVLAAVAWQSNLCDGDNHGIAFRLVGVDGAMASAELVANKWVDGDQHHPCVAVSEQGNGFVVVWDGDGPGVFAQRFHPDGYRLYR